MKKSYKFFLVAFGLIISGLIMDVIIDFIPLSINPQIKDVPIMSHSSYSFQIKSQGQTHMYGGFSSIPSGPMNMKILNPDKSILWEGTSQQSSEKGFISPNFMNPNPSGKLDVVISNLGDEQIEVTGILNDVKVIQDEFDIEGTIENFLDYIIYSLISALLKFIGIIFAVIGTILFFKERKALKN